MGKMKDVAIDLMNNFNVLTYEILLERFPNCCPQCKSKELDFHDYNNEEATWRCKNCKSFIAVEYEGSKTRSYFS